MIASAAHGTAADVFAACEIAILAAENLSEALAFVGAFKLNLRQLACSR